RREPRGDRARRKPGGRGSGRPRRHSRSAEGSRRTACGAHRDMTAPVADPGFYADLSGLAALRRGARADDPAALREAARQFESLFAKILLSSMRAASFGDSLLGSDQQDFYQGMFDDQLAVELTRGRGLGLAELLVEQLARAGLVAEPRAETTAARDSGPTKAAIAGSPDEFVRKLWPCAVEAGRELGVDPR